MRLVREPRLLTRQSWPSWVVTEQVGAPSKRACREECAENIWVCDEFNEDLIIDVMINRRKSKKMEKCAKMGKNKKSKFKSSTSLHRQCQKENDVCVNQEVVDADHDRDNHDEARRSWELGESLRLYAENEDRVIEALAESFSVKNDEQLLSKNYRKRGGRKSK